MKKENINIADALRDAPQGTLLYSLVGGEMNFRKILKNNKISCDPSGVSNFAIPILFNADGSLAFSEESGINGRGECMLFPSSICRTWQMLCFEKGDIVVLTYESKDGNKDEYMIAYNGLYFGTEIGVKYAASIHINDKHRLDLNGRYSLCAIHPDEISVSFREAKEDDKEDFIDALRIHGYMIDRNEDGLLKKIKKPKFEPFQQVMVRDKEDDPWSPAFFSHESKNPNAKYPYGTISGSEPILFYRYCIPYNDKTKHLAGTNKPYNE